MSLCLYVFVLQVAAFAVHAHDADENSPCLPLCMGQCAYMRQPFDT